MSPYAKFQNKRVVPNSSIVNGIKRFDHIDIVVSLSIAFGRIENLRCSTYILITVVLQTQYTKVN